MTIFRREFLKLASTGAGAAATALLSPQSQALGEIASMPGAGTNIVFSVKQYGAKGDGVAIDTPAINRAIDAASVSGGGTVHFPSGTYASYSIHLKSNVALYLDQGATILAASVSEGSTASGASYDPPEPKTAWDSYQDFGHNH